MAEVKEVQLYGLREKRKFVQKWKHDNGIRIIKISILSFFFKAASFPKHIPTSMGFFYREFWTQPAFVWILPSTLVKCF